MNEHDRPLSENIDSAFLTEKIFSDFDLDPIILTNLKENGFHKCTPIQAQSLPISLQGRDLAGQAQTGTGKTVAFLLTVIQKLMQTTVKPDTPRALILTPTRELADQIYKEALKIAKDTNVSFLQVVGGIDYDKQADAIKKGVDAIVATPGRIIDYYKQGVFKTDDIEILVIDEADRLLDLGFAKDIQYLLKKLPSYEKRQTMLFSATLDHSVLELTYEYMKMPEFVSITPREMISQNIKQTLIHISLERKFRLLLGILQREDWSSVMIFANTKSGVIWLAEKLKANGYAAEALTGDLPQKQRFKLMNAFKAGEIKIMIATDVASRGIHIDNVSHVINYDLPQDAENYVHRIGRTARAGKTGVSFSLACENYVYHLEPLEEMLGYKIPIDWPGDDWFPEDQAPHLSTRRGKGPKKRAARPVTAAHGARVAPHKPSGPEIATDKKPAQTVKTKGKAALIHKTPDYFPGSFFGFVSPDMVKVVKGIIYVSAKNIVDDDNDTPTANVKITKSQPSTAPIATTRSNRNGKTANASAGDETKQIKSSPVNKAADTETRRTKSGHANPVADAETRKNAQNARDAKKTETSVQTTETDAVKAAKPTRRYYKRSPKKGKIAGTPSANND